MMVAPATPRNIVDKVHAELIGILALPDIEPEIPKLGLLTFDNPSVEGLQSFVKAEIVRWHRGAPRRQSRKLRISAAASRNAGVKHGTRPRAGRSSVAVAPGGIGRRPSAGANRELPDQTGEDHLGFAAGSCRRRDLAAGRRPAGSAVGSAGGGGQSAGRRRAISARAAADAAPDGYTLYMPALSTFLAVPGRAPNLPLKLPRDFTPIGSVSQQPIFIAVAASLDVKTVPQLIALAKQRPGETLLRGDRGRRIDSPHRRTVAATSGHQAAAGALFRRAEPRPQRRAGRSHSGDHRGLFWACGGGAGRRDQADRTRRGSSGSRIFPICRRWRRPFPASSAVGLASPRCAGGHARRGRPQGERGPAQGPRSARPREAARDARRLSACDVIGRGHRLCQRTAADVGPDSCSTLRSILRSECAVLA